jgi:hypothetical protein
MYGFWPSAMVAAALASAAAVVFARHTNVVGPFGWVVVAGYVVLILVFALRGLAPYLTPVFEYARDTPFFVLNQRYYAPLCLVIAAGLALDFPNTSYLF